MSCHSEQREEPAFPRHEHKSRFLTSFGMKILRGPNKNSHRPPQPLRLFIPSRQQPHDPAQILPRRLIQTRLRAHDIPDHVLRDHIQRALRRRPHGERHRALRAKTNPVRRRLLPRLYPHRLRKHIHRDGFFSRFNLPPATQANDRLHEWPFFGPTRLRSPRRTYPLISAR